jgi:hypothetical protein
MTDRTLGSLALVSATTGLRILGFTAAGAPFAVDPLAFAAAPTSGASVSDASPLPLGDSPAAGSSPAASRADHVHARPTAAQIGAAGLTHTHAIGDVTNLQTTLNSKAATTHSHIISDVSGLQVSIDAKANLAHTHPIADVSGLTSALGLKQDTATKGQANGYAGLDNTGKVPLIQLPDTTGSGGASNVASGTVDGQIPVWSGSTGKYQPATPTPITSDGTPIVARNTATTLTFVEYNRRYIVLTGAAPLTLSAATVLASPTDVMEFVIFNTYSAVNTITFDAAIAVKPYPAGTGVGGTVKISANYSTASVVVLPVGNQLVAFVRGQIE